VKKLDLQEISSRAATRANHSAPTSATPAPRTPARATPAAATSAPAAEVADEEMPAIPLTEENVPAVSVGAITIGGLTVNPDENPRIAAALEKLALARIEAQAIDEERKNLDAKRCQTLLEGWHSVEQAQLHDHEVTKLIPAWKSSLDGQLEIVGKMEQLVERHRKLAVKKIASSPMRDKDIKQALEAAANSVQASFENTVGFRKKLTAKAG
ncbi:MAG TPA: hypothetical protein VMD74_03845, partial [Candidatus Methylomirabilis sp.]|nr:hypothetical protein [Candidatus Methylomirabilis sp.]